MNVHELRTWPETFRLVRDGSKRWELRRNDRDFKDGDLLWLREWAVAAEPPAYTGESVIVQVKRVYDVVPEGLPAGFVLMDIRRVNVTPVYE